MKRENSLNKLEKMFEAISNDENILLDEVLNQEGIESTVLVKQGLTKIEGFKRKVESLLESDRITLLNRALEKWKGISSGINEGISREIEPLLLNSNDKGLKLFFQSVSDIENQEELKEDAAKMQLEIALFRLKEELSKNQS